MNSRRRLKAAGFRGFNYFVMWLIMDATALPKSPAPLSFATAFLVTLASLMAALPAHAATTTVGTISGSFGVTPGGAATYSIPISVPRGSGGLTPSVDLVYSSQSGEGAAGYGWALSGLSAITRCNKTIEDDGSTEGVALTSSDDYCLDGQRLRSTGGSTYDTEIRSFQRITADTNSGATGGPSYWTVESKNGTTYEYGNTADSKIFATNPSGGATTVVRVWALDKVTDASGNYYTFTYQNNDASTGDYWPLNIQYTGNTVAGTSPLHTITFNWTPRSAATVQASFLHGTLVTHTQRLSGITVSYNGTSTFTYNLQYQNDPGTGRNQLASITECASDGSCFPPTTIGWQNGVAGWQSDVSTGVTVPDDTHAYVAHLMDVNGDGVQDLVYPGTTDWMVMFGLPAGGFSAPVDTSIAAQNYKYALVMDYNGDGREDLMWPDTSDHYWHVLEATGNTSGTIFTNITTTLSDTGTNSVTNEPIYEGNATTADYYGNGLSDFIYSDGKNVYAVTNTGASFGATVNLESLDVFGIPGLGITGNPEFGDVSLIFDGSGRMGSLGLDKITKTVCLRICQTTTTYDWDALASTDSGYSGVGSLIGPRGDIVTPTPVDAIGDGQSDLLWAAPVDSSGNFYWNVNLSTGTSLLGVTTSITDPGETPAIADYYGDGRQEMIVIDNNVAYWMIRINYDPSVPGFTAQATSTVAPYPDTSDSLRVGNISADGLSDLVYAVGPAGGSYTWHYRLHNGGAADLVTNITDGLGNTYEPQYVSLSDSGGAYTEGSGAVYPVQDVQIPMQVVSSYQASDGIGGTYTVSYSYKGAEMDVTGHSFLGFARRKATDSRNGVTITDKYDQTFPWVGEITQETVTQSNGQYISTTTNNYADQTSGSGSTAMYFPYLSSSTVTNYDISSGDAIKTGTTTNSAFDNYGDATNSTVAVTDNTTGQQFSIQTAITYADSAGTTWCISVPQTAIITKTNPEGSLTRETNSSNSYDDVHCRPTEAVTEASNAQSLTTAYSYDDYGNVGQVTVSGGGFTNRTTKTTYGNNGEYPVTIINALGQSESETWNSTLGVEDSTTDLNGHATTYGYDSFGRKTSETGPVGVTASWIYSLCSGSCITNGIYKIKNNVANNAGTQTITTSATVYDAKGRVIKNNNWLLGGVQSQVETVFDSLGRAGAVSKPFLSSPVYWTYTTYDVLNRPTKITAPANASDASNSDVINFAHSGFTTTITRTAPSDPSETAVKTTDALGETVKIINVHNGTNLTTSYTYDAFGDLLNTTDADGHVTAMTYDGLGHKTAMTDPDLGHWTYSLDALGELLSQTDAKNQVTQQSYDALGRLTSREECTATCSASTKTVTDTWTYDTAANGIGLLALESDSNGFQKAYTYDSLGRPIDVDTTVGGTDYLVSTTYDSFGRVSTVTYPTSVAPSVPVAKARVSPASQIVGQTPYPTLDGSGSTDPEGLSLNYQWSQTSGPVIATLSAPTGETSTITTSTPGVYQIQLVVSDQNEISAPVSVSVTFLPPAPGTPSISPNPSTNGSYTISWNAVTSATSYNLYQSTDGTNYTNIASVSSTSYAVSGKTSGTYYYKVAACANSVCSGLSSAASVQVTDIIPAPGNLTLTPNPSTTGGYTLGWAAVTGATSYDIYLSVNGGGFSLLVNTAATSYVASEGDGSYGYYLTACNAGGCSNPSSTVTESVTLPPGTPGTPSVTPNPSTTGSFIVSWSTPSGTYTSMQMEESPNQSSWTTEATSGTTWSGSGFSNGTYYFKTIYCDGTACSSSAVGSVTVLHPPVAPTGLAISPPGQNGTGSYILSWSASATATSYQVYRSTGGSYTEIATPSSTSYAVSGEGNGTYYYYVKACNASGCSGASATFTVVVLLYPGKPSSISLAPNPTTAFHSFTLSWGSASGTVSYYIINGNTSTHYTTLSWTNQGMPHGSYSYYVQACNSSGCGPATATVTETVTGGGCKAPQKSPAPDCAAPSGSTSIGANPPISSISSPINNTPTLTNGRLSSATTFSTAAPGIVLSTKRDSSIVLTALRRERKVFSAHLLEQASEVVMQEDVARRKQAMLPSLMPPAPASDVAAWNAWVANQKRLNPNGATYAPPEYIAYADAKIQPASSTSNRFAVQYQYDPASGALAAVVNAQTGFVYWQADTGSAAPVDAFGHLLAYTDGNNVSTVTVYDQATGAIVGISSGIGNSSAVQSLVYTWDGYGNLTERQDYNRNVQETFGYDDLNRLSDSLVTNPAGNGPDLSLTYDPMGNILTKSNVGTYTYDASHPYAVDTIKNASGTVVYSASYDANGNMTTRNGYQIGWTVDNLPENIASATGSSAFSYDPDHTRYYQAATYNGVTTDTTYIGSLFEVVASSTTTEYRHMIVANGQVIAVHTITGSGVASTGYLHSDHLGSIDTITDTNGNVTQSMSFDAFGLRRDPANWDYDLTASQIATLKSTTDRGYTDQEQLDNVGLIHMNGRVYDPLIGRFISADPMEAGNRYAYVDNNPLAHTDPSGYCWLGCFWQPNAPLKLLNNLSNTEVLLLTGLTPWAHGAVNHSAYELENNRDIQLAVAIALSVWTGGASIEFFEYMEFNAFWTAVGEGAVAGGVFSGAMGTFAGQSPADVIDETLKGAAAGAISAGLTYGANDLTAYTGNNFAVGVVSHGVAGGLSSVAAGGSFSKGFEMGGLAYGAQTIYQHFANNNSADLAPARGGAVYKCQGPACIGDNGPNNLNWGNANLTTNPALVGTPVTTMTCLGLLCEGGTISKIMNYVPFMPATSLTHDIMGDMVYGVGTSVPAWFNYSTMVPAFALSVAASVSSSMGAAIMTANDALKHGGGG